MLERLISNKLSRINLCILLVYFVFTVYVSYSYLLLPRPNTCLCYIFLAGYNNISRLLFGLPRLPWIMISAIVTEGGYFLFTVPSQMKGQ